MNSLAELTGGQGPPELPAAENTQPTHADNSPEAALSCPGVPPNRTPSPPLSGELLEAALHYGALGYRVIPVRPGSKATDLVDWPNRATTDADQIREWWTSRPDSNIGLVATNMVNIDIDSIDNAANPWPDGRSLEPAGGIARTPGGGHHFFYRLPDGREYRNSTSRLADHVDVKTRAGYVVVPPSWRSDTGSSYQWEQPLVPFAELPLPPRWLIRELDGLAERTVRPVASVAHRAAPAAATEEMIPEGNRNAELASIGGRLRRDGLAPEELAATLQAVNERRCQPPLDAEEVERIAASVGRYPPAFSLSGQPVMPGPNGQTSTGGTTPQDSRPRIQVREDDLTVLLREAWNAIEVYNRACPRVFRFSHSVSIVETGEPVIRALCPESMRELLARAARWYRMQREGTGEDAVPTDAKAPSDLARIMLATPSETLPALLRIVRTPIVAPSGRIVVAEGYDAETRVYYAPCGLTVPEVSQQPSEEEIAAACELILGDLLGDFPFVDQADRANALAMFLTPFAREIIGDNPTPLFLIEKPSPGSGAGLMLEALGLIVRGDPPAFMTEARDEDEWRKRITSTLLSGPEMVCLDNLRGRLDSAALSSALTARVWQDRRLGASENVTIPIRCVWAASGNNPGVSDEIARRVVSIRIDPRMERPWERSPEGFRHPRLLEWVRENRSRLIHAALTLVRAWIAAGRQPGGGSLGSYEAWAENLSGILETAGIEGFLGNQARFYERADREATTWRAFVGAWWQTFGTDVVGVRRLWSLIEPMSAIGTLEVDPPCDLGRGNERSQRIKLGDAIAQAVDRRFLIDGTTLKIEAAGTQQRAAQYRLVSLRTS